MSDSIDTNVLIAAMIESEPFHTECRKLVVGKTSSLYSHGISEAFNTLTGGRRPFRLRATAAADLLERHFVPRCRVVSLSPSETLRALRDCESRGVRGGALFDYLHLIAARKAKARRLYTLNISNFRAFHRPGDPEIVHP